MLLQTLQLFRRVCQQKIGDSVVARGKRPYRDAVEEQHRAVGRCLDAKRVRRLVGKSNELAGDVKSNNSAMTILEGSTSSKHTLAHDNDVVGGIAFQRNDFVARVTNRTMPEVQNASYRQVRIALVIP
jgi:hypothetical protein